MTGKERVKRAIKFQGPDRIPLRYAFNRERSDIIGVGYVPSGYWRPKVEGKMSGVVFGISWKEEWFHLLVR